LDKIPSLKLLKKEIEKPDIQDSINFLKSKSTDLAKYEDIEDLVFQVSIDSPPKELRGFNFHFLRVRAAVARGLWSRGIFIGLSVIDELLFSRIRDAYSKDPVLELLTIIKDNDVHKPGFVLYPIHSMGVNGVGFLESYYDHRPILYARVSHF